MSNRGVRDGEFTQVVANHFRLDFNRVEDLTVVDSNDGTDHFWDNDHVSQVGLDSSRLFVRLSGQLGSSQLQDQTLRLGTQTSGESSSNSSRSQLDELFGFQFQQVLQVNTLVGEGLESSLSSVS